MNERQRDLFLWIWSRRRTLGQAGAALRGGAIGAAGGFVFALVMSSQIGSSAPAYDMLAQITPNLRLFGLSIAAFGVMGWLLAGRVFASQEAMYQSILRSGAQPPAEKPVMQGADRWPAMAVAVVAGLLAVGIIALFIAYW